MRNIMLFCAMGLSTRLLVSKMQSEADILGLELRIWAVNQQEYENDLALADVCLLGPQVRHKLREAREKGAKLGILIDVIDMMDYGSCNGQKVLNQALKLLDEKDKK